MGEEHDAFAKRVQTFGRSEDATRKYPSNLDPKPHFR
jgi:hypothetical protein